MKPLDNLFATLLNLWKAILLLPFNLYISWISWFVLLWCRVALFVLKIAETLPVVGPKLLAGEQWLVSNIPGMRWVMKFKDE